MNASIRGTMFVKADRINQRIDKIAAMFKNEPLTQENFKDFIKSVHIIVDTELTDKGVKREWKE